VKKIVIDSNKERAKAKIASREKEKAKITNKEILE